jgi:hypothetical protein
MFRNEETDLLPVGMFLSVSNCQGPWILLTLLVSKTRKDASSATTLACNSHSVYVKSYGTYEGVSKIFRTDAVKIIKLTIRPIGRHHPRSSSFPHVDTGPSVSSIFGTLSGSPFLSECQALSPIRSESPQYYQICVFLLQFHFWKYEEVTGCQIRGIRWVGDDSHFVFCQKQLGEDERVRWDVVIVKQAGLFSPKFGATSSHVFTQSPQNMTVEPGIHNLACWDRCFALPQLLYRWRHQSGIFGYHLVRHKCTATKWVREAFL